MSRATADKLWGAEAVAEALAEPDYEPPTAAGMAEIQRMADPPGRFRAWALTLSWARFCTVVRTVSGELKNDLLGGAEVKEPSYNLSMRVPQSWIDRTDEVAVAMREDPAFLAVSSGSRAAVLRLVLLRGLEALEREAARKGKGASK